jgi:hypothetical protein
MFRPFSQISFGIIILASCTQNSRDKDVIPSNDSSNAIDTANTISDAKTDKYFWTAELDEATGKLQIKKARPLQADSLNAVIIVGLINNGYPDVKLQFTKISSDTIYVKIPKSTYLTQQMGTTGAEMYLANATYNLTELPNISYVNFDFIEGDHAEPGTFSKKDFEEEQTKGF